MAWVAVDAYSDEYIFQNKPKRDGNWWVDQSIVQLRQEVERIKPPRIPEQILESTRDCIGEFMRIIIEHAHLITGEKIRRNEEDYVQ